MIRNIIRSTGPNIPVLYVDANINQAKAINLLKKLRQLRFDFTQGIAIVSSIQNCMPVQVDKIAQEVLRIKKQHKIPVYGFLLDQCTPQNLYMTSVADEVYSLKSTIFNLQPKQNKINLSGLYQNLNIQHFSIRSGQNLSAVNLDNYTSANTQQFINQKQTNIIHQLIHQIQINQKKTIPIQSLNKPFLGEQALGFKLIDGFNQHESFLREKFPQCYFNNIKYLDQPKDIKKSMALLTSPILLALFIFKVILKWSLIMYFWIKSANKQNKQETNHIST